MKIPVAFALEDDWKRTLDDLGRARGWPTSGEPAKLGALVRLLSDAYNDVPSANVATSAQALAARLGFSFARDVPKSAAAVNELVTTGVLTLPSDRPLRLLDVGAGLGATTWGIARALAESGARGAIEATWIDEDAAALELGQAIVRARGGVVRSEHATGHGEITLTVRIEKRRAMAEADARGRYDLVLLGQVLSELDPGMAEEERAARHVALVRAFLGSTSARGSLVIVEPALRARTRHLHRVRDLLLADHAATVFAPCLHASACPALAAAGDWCHEDRPIDLPPWLVPVARAAGLRWQGLTFAYLVLRDPNDPRSLIDAIAPSSSASPDARAARFRVVSAPLVSKGKCELFCCGPSYGVPEASAGANAETSGADATKGASDSLNTRTRLRITRLDRDASPTNAAWETLGRGVLVAIDPPPDPQKPRIPKDATVRVLDLPSVIDGAKARQ